MNESLQEPPIPVQPVSYYAGSATEQSLRAMLGKVAVLCIVVGGAETILQFWTAYTLANLYSSLDNSRALIFTVTAALKGIANLLLVVGALGVRLTGGAPWTRLTLLGYAWGLIIVDV